jgi:predicted  nucleic acid-binding Zn-ribbon protein
MRSPISGIVEAEVNKTRMPKITIQKGINDLASQYPKVAAEWDYTKNEGVTPSDIPAHTNKKYWWKCSACGYEFEASPNSRTRSGPEILSGCPVCGAKRTAQARHKKAVKENNLAAAYPDIAKEWDIDKNGKNPDEVAAHSGESVWWVCPRGHSYRKKIADRTGRGIGCPYCSGQQVLVGFNDLKSQNPKLASEWDYERNGSLRPENVTSGSAKTVWWKCGKGHEWKAIIANRQKGRGCPYCANRKVLKGFNDMQTLRPDIAIDWDYEKNGDITPSDVIPGSNKQFWWKCHVCGYEWRASGNNRTSGHGCPKCGAKSAALSNRKRNLIAGKTDLRTVAPELIDEWDYEKNGDLKPEDFTAGSRIKIWWKCKKYGHSWQAPIYTRAKGSGCPYCHSHTSYPEQAIYYYLSQTYPDAVNTDTHLGFELDIYVPSIKVAVEYDGVAYHGHRVQKEIQKNSSCREAGIRLIRVRENGLPSFEDCGIIWVKPTPSDNELNAAITSLFAHIGGTANIDVARDQLAILDTYHQYEVNHSLSTKFPDIADEWDYEKNGTLAPEMFSYGSMRKVWWKCSKGHEWYDSINNRTSEHTLCPYCSGKRAIPGETDFATLYPDLMKEWDFGKNGKVDPHKILPKINRKVWWRCSKGHEWQASINSRTNRESGCPYCYGRFAIPGENDLATTNPEILKEWSHKNTDIEPTEIKAGSERKVWWHCAKCGHDYKAAPYNRIYGHTGCPYCANQVPEFTRKQREGQEVTSKSGQKMKVLRYRKAIDIDVEFEDGTIVEHRNYFNFLKGAIKNPNYPPKIKQ